MASEAWTVFAGVDFAPWRLFDTTDLDEARERCARVLNPHALEVLGRGQRLHARMAHRRLGPLSLNRLSWQAPVAVDPGRLDDYYLLSLPVRGEAVFHLDGETIDVTPQRPAIVSGAQRFRLTASEGFDQIVLRTEQLAAAHNPSVIIVSFIADDVRRTELRRRADSGHALRSAQQLRRTEHQLLAPDRELQALSQQAHGVALLRVARAQSVRARREMERRQLGSLRLLRPDVRRAQSGVVLRRQTARLRLRGPVSSRRGRALIVATGAAEQQRDGQVAELIKRAPGPVPTLGSYLHHFTLRILSICRFHNTLPEVQRPKPAPFTGTQKPAPRFLRRACVPCYLACLP